MALTTYDIFHINTYTITLNKSTWQLEARKIYALHKSTAHLQGIIQQCRFHLIIYIQQGHLEGDLGDTLPTKTAIANTAPNGNTGTGM